MRTIKLHLIRHGVAKGNKDNIMIGGATDTPLMEEGEEQLRQLAARFPYPAVGAVFCSPMRRAGQTARILYPDVPGHVVLEDLREIRFGEFEGRHWREVRHEERFKTWNETDSAVTPENGESQRDFGTRVLRALQQMLLYQAENGVWEAACVTHCEVIMNMMARRVAPARQDRYGWLADNGCGYTLQTDTAMILREAPLEAVGLVPLGYDGDLMGQRLRGELLGMHAQGKGK